MSVYVAGFVTSEENVLLMLKTRPLWQIGLYNGVGGLVKKNEKPLDAMFRKAKEETGLSIKEWNVVTYIAFTNGIELNVYHADIKKSDFNKIKTITDEKLQVFNIDNLPSNIVEDIKGFLSVIEKKNNKNIKREWSFPEVRKDDYKPVVFMYKNKTIDIDFFNESKADYLSEYEDIDCIYPFIAGYIPTISDWKRIGYLVHSE